MNQTKMFTKFLMLCGIFSSILYIGTDIFASCLYKDYCYTSQQISELSAIGAPTKQLWIAMSYIWAPLVIVFGIGIMKQPFTRRFLRLVGMLFVIYGIIGLLWNIAPMHQRGTATLVEDRLHIIFAGIQILIIFSFIILGSGAGGKGFRIYSIVTIIVIIFFGTWTGTQVSAIAEGQPTPWIGLVERVNVYSPMVWMIVFAFILLRVGNRSYNVII